MIAEVGLDAIEKHVRGLADRFIADAGYRGFELLTPTAPAERGPLVMVGASDAPRLVAALASQGILCSTRDGALRVSLHYYNSAGDVDAVLSALDDLPDLVSHQPH